MRMRVKDFTIRCMGPLFLMTTMIMTTQGDRSDYSRNRQQILDDLLADYDGRIPPAFQSGEPVVSKVQLYILSIDSISESTMDFAMSFFLRQRWHDHRLQFNITGNISRLELDTRIMDSVWVPDLYMLNEKKASVHDVSVPNKLMHIYPSGLIVYSMRVSGTFTCNMDLLKYPLDQQICDVVIESYGLSTKTLLLRWNKIPVEKSPTLELPQFELSDLKNYICDTSYAGVNYTCIKVTMALSRKYGYYMIQVYIPSVLIVLLSWVSFWLNIDAIPARISLGLLTVLTMTTQSSGARASLPKVSYIKAIDVWMVTCLSFVFAALVEFAYVNVLARVEQRRRSSIKDLPKLVHVTKDNEEENSKKKSKMTFLSSESREKARTVDKVSRIVFPLVFFVFNLIYWMVYSFWQPVLDHEGHTLAQQKAT